MTQDGEIPRAEETPLGRALRRIAKGRRLTSLDVPVLDDAADLVDQLTAEITELNKLNAIHCDRLQWQAEQDAVIDKLRAEVKTRDEQIAQMGKDFTETVIRSQEVWQALDSIMVDAGMNPKAQPPEAQQWLREQLSTSQALREALQQLRDAVKQEPAMNHMKYDALGVKVNRALALAAPSSTKKET